jgi:hypothetical protein
MYTIMNTGYLYPEPAGHQGPKSKGRDHLRDYDDPAFPIT